MPIRAQTPGEVARLYGDGAYDRGKVHNRLADPSQQATPIESVIPLGKPESYKVEVNR